MSYTINIFNNKFVKKYNNPYTFVLNDSSLVKNRKTNCETPFRMPIRGYRRVTNCDKCEPNEKITKDKINCDCYSFPRIKNSNSVILNNNFFFNSLSYLQNNNSNFTNSSVSRDDSCLSGHKYRSMHNRNIINKLKHNTNFNFAITRKYISKDDINFNYCCYKQAFRHKKNVYDHLFSRHYDIKEKILLVSTKINEINAIINSDNKKEINYFELFDFINNKMREITNNDLINIYKDKYDELLSKFNVLNDIINNDTYNLKETPYKININIYINFIQNKITILEKNYSSVENILTKELKQITSQNDDINKFIQNYINESNTIVDKIKDFNSNFNYEDYLNVENLIIEFRNLQNNIILNLKTKKKKNNEYDYIDNNVNTLLKITILNKINEIKSSFNDDITDLISFNNFYASNIKDLNIYNEKIELLKKNTELLQEHYLSNENISKNIAKQEEIYKTIAEIQTNIFDINNNINNILLNNKETYLTNTDSINNSLFELSQNYKIIIDIDSIELNFNDDIIRHDQFTNKEEILKIFDTFFNIDDNYKKFSRDLINIQDTPLYKFIFNLNKDLNPINTELKRTDTIDNINKLEETINSFRNNTNIISKEQKNIFDDFKINKNKTLDILKTLRIQSINNNILLNIPLSIDKKDKIVVTAFLDKNTIIKFYPEFLKENIKSHNTNKSDIIFIYTDNSLTRQSVSIVGPPHGLGVTISSTSSVEITNMTTSKDITIPNVIEKYNFYQLEQTNIYKVIKPCFVIWNLDKTFFLNNSNILENDYVYKDINPPIKSFQINENIMFHKWDLIPSNAKLQLSDKEYILPIPVKVFGKQLEIINDLYSTNIDIQFKNEIAQIKIDTINTTKDILIYYNIYQKNNDSWDFMERVAMNNSKEFIIYEKKYPFIDNIINIFNYDSCFKIHRHNNIDILNWEYFSNKAKEQGYKLPTRNQISQIIFNYNEVVYFPIDEPNSWFLTSVKNQFDSVNLGSKVLQFDEYKDEIPFKEKSKFQKALFINIYDEIEIKVDIHDEYDVLLNNDDFSNRNISKFTLKNNENITVDNFKIENINNQYVLTWDTIKNNYHNYCIIYKYGKDELLNKWNLEFKYKINNQYDNEYIFIDDDLINDKKYKYEVSSVDIFFNESIKNKSPEVTYEYTPQTSISSPGNINIYFANNNNYESNDNIIEIDWSYLYKTEFEITVDDLFENTTNSKYVISDNQINVWINDEVQYSAAQYLAYAVEEKLRLPKSVNEIKNIISKLSNKIWWNLNKTIIPINTTYLKWVNVVYDDILQDYVYEELDIIDDIIKNDQLYNIVSILVEPNFLKHFKVEIKIDIDNNILIDTKTNVASSEYIYILPKNFAKNKYFNLSISVIAIPFKNSNYENSKSTVQTFKNLIILDTKYINCTKQIFFMGKGYYNEIYGDILRELKLYNTNIQFVNDSKTNENNTNGLNDKHYYNIFNKNGFYANEFSRIHKYIVNDKHTFDFYFKLEEPFKIKDYRGFRFGNFLLSDNNDNPYNNVLKNIQEKYMFHFFYKDDNSPEKNNFENMPLFNDYKKINNFYKREELQNKVLEVKINNNPWSGINVNFNLNSMVTHIKMTIDLGNTYNINFTEFYEYYINLSKDWFISVLFDDTNNVMMKTTQYYSSVVEKNNNIFDNDFYSSVPRPITNSNNGNDSYDRLVFHRNYGINNNISELPTINDEVNYEYLLENIITYRNISNVSYDNSFNVINVNPCTIKDNMISFSWKVGNFYGNTYPTNINFNNEVLFNVYKNNEIIRIIKNNTSNYFFEDILDYDDDDYTISYFDQNNNESKRSFFYLLNENSIIEFQQLKISEKSLYKDNIICPLNFYISFDFELDKDFDFLTNILHINNNSNYDPSTFNSGSSIFLINLLPKKKNFINEYDILDPNTDDIREIIDNQDDEFEFVSNSDKFLTKINIIFETISSNISINSNLIPINTPLKLTFAIKNDKFFLNILNRDTQEEYNNKIYAFNEIRKTFNNCNLFLSSSYINSANISLQNLSFKEIIPIKKKDKPKAPTNLFAQSKLYKKVNLFWNKYLESDNISTIIITEKNDKYKPIRIYGNQNKYTIYDLLKGETYYFQIQIKNTDNEFSDISEFPPATTNIYDKVNIINADIINAEEDFCVVLNWEKYFIEDVSNLVYKIYVITPYTEEHFLVSNLNTTFFEYNNLRKGIHYDFYISVINSFSNIESEKSIFSFNDTLYDKIYNMNYRKITKNDKLILNRFLKIKNYFKISLQMKINKYSKKNANIFSIIQKKDNIIYPPKSIGDLICSLWINPNSSILYVKNEIFNNNNYYINTSALDIFLKLDVIYHIDILINSKDNDNDILNIALYRKNENDKVFLSEYNIDIPKSKEYNLDNCIIYTSHPLVPSANVDICCFNVQNIKKFEPLPIYSIDVVNIANNTIWKKETLRNMNNKIINLFDAKNQIDKSRFNQKIIFNIDEINDTYKNSFILWPHQDITNGHYEFLLNEPCEIFIFCIIYFNNSLLYINEISGDVNDSWLEKGFKLGLTYDKDKKLGNADEMKEYITKLKNIGKLSFSLQQLENHKFVFNDIEDNGNKIPSGSQKVGRKWFTFEDWRDLNNETQCLPVNYYYKRVTEKQKVIRLKKFQKDNNFNILFFALINPS